VTSTPVILLLKRSGQSSDRPQTSVVQNGELAIAVGAADPGLYFEDSAGSIRKIGPSQYGTTAPNSTPVGLAGNSVGELWTDSSTGSYYLKVWTGGAWQKVGAGFADSATTATTATTATFATQASTATLSSGTILASGAVFSNTATLSSGTILASGAVFSNTATLSSGTILASGAVFSNTATLSSGTILASGAIQSSTVVLSGLPSPISNPSGTLIYQIQSSGVFGAGLYVRATDTWLLV
jgi:hypothetical protein